MSILKVKLMRPGARLPKRETQGSAGHDLSAAIDQPVIIQPGEIAKIPTGVAIQLEDKNQVALVFGRSGLGIKHGIAPVNGVGVIDSDYRGEMVVGLVNHGPQAFTIQPGDRIAQMVIVPVVLPQIMQVEELDETQRGAGGLGSTGKA